MRVLNNVVGVDLWFRISNDNRLNLFNNSLSNYMKIHLSQRRIFSVVMEGAIL